MRNTKMKRLFRARGILILLLMCISTLVMAQTKSVTGSVVDERGENIIGASISVKGTTTGTITDIDGNFSITVTPQDVLLIKYLGYVDQSITVGNQMHIHITMREDDQLLDEVVVVGYGVQKKSDVTGALTRVGADELSARPVGSALEALQGKAAGVDITSSERPGTIGSIRIRGRRSLNATSDPLYVVDGIPLSSGGIEALNPKDIESIDILKDASSTAIYGSRGANGVVLITTKRGKTGARQIDYSGTVTFEKIHDLSPAMSASDYITWRRWAYYNSAPDIYTPGDQPTMAQDEAFFGTGLDPTALTNVMRGWVNGVWNPSGVIDTDWTDLVTQTGITHEHTISARAGSDHMRSSISFGYLNNEGTQKGQKYERYTAAITTDITATPWVTLGGSINGSWGVQDYGFSATGQTSSTADDIYSAAKNIFRYALPYDEEGNRIIYPGGQSGIYTVIDEWEKSIDNRQTLRALGSFYANLDFGKMWNPLNGLEYKFTFGPDYRYFRQGLYIDSNSAVRKGSTSLANMVYNRKLSWTLDNQITYNKVVKDHRFTVTLVQSASRYNEEKSGMSGENIPKASYKWHNMGSLDVTSTEANVKISSGLSEWQLASYMARINYALKDRYLLTLSGRYDGSSVLAEGNKWDFFPSAAIAWRLDQEDFIRDINGIEQLKLRLGMGSVGNAAISPYQTLGDIQSFYVPFGGQGNSLAYATNEPYSVGANILMANPELGWERTVSFNYGLDYSFLRGRINGTLDIYNSHTKDLLMKMTIPTLTGYNETWANVGETKNFGIEMSVNFVPVQTRDFEWISTVNAAYQKDKVISLANGKQDMIDSGWLIGQSISIYYGYQHDGLWQESDQEEMAKFNEKGHNFEAGMVKPVDQNGDYKIDAEDRVVKGNRMPRWTLGWNNTFSYKGIELTIELYGRLGYMTSTGGEGQTGIRNQRQIDYWTPTNTNAEWQKPIYNTSGGDSYSSLLGYKNASFIKFRNVSLGYVFPQKVCRTMRVNNLKVYGQLKNPGNLYSSVNFIDLDLGTSYYNRGFTLGLQIGF